MLELFDRVHGYTENPDPAGNRAHALRQMRRTQIMAEIKELSTSKLDYRNRVRISSAVLLIGLSWYATVHFLLK